MIYCNGEQHCIFKMLFLPIFWLILHVLFCLFVRLFCFVCLYLFLFCFFFFRFLFFAFVVLCLFVFLMILELDLIDLLYIKRYLLARSNASRYTVQFIFFEKCFHILSASFCSNNNNFIFVMLLTLKVSIYYLYKNAHSILTKSVILYFENHVI